MKEEEAMMKVLLMLAADSVALLTSGMGECALRHHLAAGLCPRGGWREALHTGAAAHTLGIHRVRYKQHPGGVGRFFLNFETELVMMERGDTKWRMFSSHSVRFGKKIKKQKFGR